MMGATRPSAAQVCLEEYTALARERAAEGLDHGEIAKSSLLNSWVTGRRAYLRSRACKPTAVALGCPLPDPKFQRLLRAVASGAGSFIRKTIGTNAPPFALVPPSFYHVTIVNRDHFDLGDGDRRIRSITPVEKASIDRIVGRYSRGPITVRFKGLLLTRSGRLFVPGYADGAELFRLRADLSAAMAVLRKNVPVTAHLKLGHILVHLRGHPLDLLEAWLANEASRIDARLQFRALYTPAGKISLRDVR